MERFLTAKLRQSESPFWSILRRVLKSMRMASLPRLPKVGALLQLELTVRHGTWQWFRSQYCEQIMSSRCERLGRRIRWEGDVPLIYGDGVIHIGDHVSVGNRQTWAVGLKVYSNATLTIGDYTTINYQTLISVAKEVRIGRHCLFAGDLKIFDNNSHSLDWAERRANRPLRKDEVAPVLIDDDVWVGSNCIILKGVHIGRGAVIAAGSIVTHDIPPFTLAGGVPARIIKSLPTVKEGMP